MGIDHCREIELPKVVDPNGNLTAIEGGLDVPFEIKRVFYLYDVPGGAQRGGHGHRRIEQLVIALSGNFDFELDDGSEKKLVHLDRPNRGLYLPPMIWRTMDHFSSGAVCMVLASDHFDEDEYIRDYSEFKSLIGERK
jgi:hypothetical protein